MNKLKELWGNNKVLILLGVILIGCIIAIACVTISFFFGGNKTVYGDRLEGIEKYPITDDLKKEYINSLKEDENVSDAKIDIKGKIVYITIEFVGDTALIDAQSRAAASLANFSEDLLGFYDITFTLKCKETENSEGWIILGAKNAAGSGLVWNNNTPLESEEEE